MTDINADLKAQWETKGRQATDKNRIYMLLDLNHRAKNKPAQSWTGGMKCPRCGSKLDKRQIELSRDEYAIYYQCSEDNCTYDYAVKKEHQKGLGFFNA